MVTCTLAFPSKMHTHSALINVAGHPSLAERQRLLIGLLYKCFTAAVNADIAFRSPAGEARVMSCKARSTAVRSPACFRYCMCAPMSDQIPVSR